MRKGIFVKIWWTDPLNSDSWKCEKEWLYNIKNCLRNIGSEDV
jgi:hypothetical protein